eukprot:scaffold71970_cov63-Phaeocystis_antarctica.AAC.3
MTSRDHRSNGTESNAHMRIARVRVNRRACPGKAKRKSTTAKADSSAGSAKLPVTGCIARLAVAVSRSGLRSLRGVSRARIEIPIGAARHRAPCTADKRRTESSNYFPGFAATWHPWRASAGHCWPWPAGRSCAWRAVAAAWWSARRAAQSATAVAPARMGTRWVRERRGLDGAREACGAWRAARQ